MIRRILEDYVLDQISYFPAVVLVGPRQVGKTTLVKTLQQRLPRPSIYLDLELPSQRDRLTTDTELYLSNRADQTIILDEVQQLPDLFPLLRGLIDQRREAGRFLLLGSASPSLLRNTSESLAGRVVYLEMHPLLLEELPLPASYRLHWLRGGFPNAYLAPNTKRLRDWFESFVATYLQRDLPQLGLSASPDLVRRLLTMLASQQGGLLNYANIARSLGLGQTTVQRYIDFLEQAFLIRRLEPYFVNVGKRLTKSPKAYVRDSGMVHHLLRLYDEEALIGHPAAGGSWEGYVIQQVVAVLGTGSQAFFYRTQQGSELDLVIEQGGRIVVALEIKLSNQPTLSKGNTVALQDLDNPPLLLVTPSASDDELRPGVYLCSVATLPTYLERFAVYE
ncbi:ATP-binding protein [Fibrella sp. HMF5335]|uniref:ATP-binding protein n=1 Tax=Fibrella rubiginis TaxID=2817060 RepID=A0A939K204_9BACT|nr:ATP-binding protein [Fibrella rubiginis]MBO0937702.1 ATP-binding protein [Fibrella rubiginis]